MSQQPSEWAMGKARKIASSVFDVTGPLASFHEPLAEVIALAIDAARKVPEGCVRQGVTDHKVLGTLPMTADGCVVSQGANVYGPGQDGSICGWVIGYEDWPEGTPVGGVAVGWGGPQYDNYSVEETYSTREAAEAARKDGKR